MRVRGKHSGNGNGNERGAAPMKANITSELDVVISYRVEDGKYSLFIFTNNVLLLERYPLVTRLYFPKTEKRRDK